MKMRIFKIITDTLMLIGLFLLMAFPLTGHELHMWIGIGEFILFAVHNALNFGFYRSIFKGKYTPVRIMYLTVDLLCIVSVVCLFVSAVILSDCFGLVVIRSGNSFARLLHLLASYWGFMIMSLHIGVHWGGICGAVKKRVKVNGAVLAVCRAAAAVIAVYGAYVFIKNNIWAYMILKNQFVNFNLSHGKTVFIVEHIAMSGLWICTAHYGLKAVKRNRR